MSSIKEALLRCSFCGKTQEEVKKIIAGPTVYICDECIDLCNEIMEEEYQNEHAEEFQHELLKPAEIKEVLDKYVVGQEQSKKVLAVAVRGWAVAGPTALAALAIGRGLPYPDRRLGAGVVRLVLGDVRRHQPHGGL